MSESKSLVDQTCNVILTPFVFAASVADTVCIGPFRVMGRLLSGKSKDKQGNPDACPRFADIPEEAETDKIDAAWPPAPHPVEALSVQDLIRANGKLIRELCYATTLSEEEAQAYLLPVITNLARIVHLTPASEYDHHQGYGGLFTHSLEVAYYAANEAKSSIFDRSAKPETLHQNKRRWILTAVLAALSHDIGKPFTDMEITAPDGRHWVRDEPLVDWLRNNRIESYYISFRPNREHNQHKSAALANMSMLIPKDTFTFLGATGYGEMMMKELRTAILEGKSAGLIGKILDNADGLSRNVDGLRQRKIRPEFKNVAHPQGDQLLKAIRALIQSAKWTTNKDEKSRVFNTKQGCYIVWSEAVAQEVRSQALDMGFESLPSDFLRLASILADAGAAMRNTDEVSNTHNIFWRMTPIVRGNVQFECVRLTDPQLVFDATPPAAIEAIVEGLVVDDVTKAAWIAKWKFLPVQRISREEEEAMGYSDEFVQSLTEQAEENLRNEEEIARIQSVLDAEEYGSQPAAPKEPAEAPRAEAGPAGDEAISFSAIFGGEVPENFKTQPAAAKAKDERENAPTASETPVQSPAVSETEEELQPVETSPAPAAEDVPEIDAPGSNAEEEVPEWADNVDETGAVIVDTYDVDDPAEEPYPPEEFSKHYNFDPPEADEDDEEHRIDTGRRKEVVNDEAFDMSLLMGAVPQKGRKKGDRKKAAPADRQEASPVSQTPAAKPAASEAEMKPDRLVFFNEPIDDIRSRQDRAAALQPDAEPKPELPPVTVIDPPQFRKGKSKPKKSQPVGVWGSTGTTDVELTEDEPSPGSLGPKADNGAAASDKPRKAAKKEKAADILNRQSKAAAEMAASLVSQLSSGFGIWLDEGVTTDPLTGRLCTRSVTFEQVLRDAGIEFDLVELEFEKAAAQNTVPRVSWDRENHKLVLVE